MQCLQIIVKATGYWVGRPSSRQPQMAHVPALLISLTLFTYCSYTKSLGELK